MQESIDSCNHDTNYDYSEGFKENYFNTNEQPQKIEKEHGELPPRNADNSNLKLPRRLPLLVCDGPEV